VVDADVDKLKEVGGASVMFGVGSHNSKERPERGMSKENSINERKTKMEKKMINNKVRGEAATHAQRSLSLPIDVRNRH
jgi:hypothetical protein